MRTLLAIAALILSPGVAFAQGNRADETAIRARVTGLQTAINKRDAAGAAAHYAADADLMIVDGPLAVGRAAIQGAVERDWGTAPPSRRISISVTGIRLLSPDVAVVNTLAQLSEGAVREDRGTWVLVRQGGN